MKSILAGLQTAAIAALGIAALYGFHRWREPARARAVVEGRATPAGTVRIGYFPNITHAQALVGLARGTFQQSLGREAAVETMTFNAGPSAVEALFAGSVDLVYIGPNPAINAYVKSRGENVRIVAGAASGGVSLVVRAGVADLRGRTVATPQLGNTQDVAARSWLRAQALDADLTIQPMPHADQLNLFLQGKLDAAWSVEPWVTRLLREGGGRLFLDERTLWPGGAFATTVVLARKSFLDQRPDLVRRFLRAHVETTRWIQSNPREARAIVNEEFGKLTGKKLPEEILEEAFSRIDLTWDPLAGTLEESARRAFELGYLGREKPDLSGIADLRLLNEVLGEK